MAQPLNLPSATKAELATLAALHRGRERREAGACLVEGAVLLAEALDAGLVPRLVAVEQDRPSTAWSAGAGPGRDVVERARALGGRVVAVEARLAARVSDRDNARGLLAAVPLPPPFDAAAAGLPPAGPVLLVMLCGLQDPGNVGTLVRTAAAFGAAGLLTAPGSVDPFGPKALRASAGAAFSLPLAVTDYDAAAQLAAEWELQAVVSRPPARSRAGDTATGAASVTDATDATGLPERCLLLLGHETRGVPAVDLADHAVAACVPQARGTESLNVSVAGAVLMADWYRAHGLRAGRSP